jgi:hypothetical protein
MNIDMVATAFSSSGNTFVFIPYRVQYEPEEVKAALVTCGGICPGLNDIVRQILIFQKSSLCPPISTSILLMHESSLFVEMYEVKSACILRSGLECVIILYHIKLFVLRK